MRKKKTEFKKIVLAVILALCFGFVLWSYLLATFGIYEVNEGIATALIYTVVGAYVSYVLASYGEKNSRNKYEVDENGNKRTENARITHETHEKGGEKGDD